MKRLPFDLSNHLTGKLNQLKHSYMIQKLSKRAGFLAKLLLLIKRPLVIFINQIFVIPIQTVQFRLSLGAIPTFFVEVCATFVSVQRRLPASQSIGVSRLRVDTICAILSSIESSQKSVNLTNVWALHSYCQSLPKQTWCFYDLRNIFSLLSFIFIIAVVCLW